jgi:hypothetical protein
MFPGGRICALSFAWPAIVVVVTACRSGAADTAPKSDKEKWYVDRSITVSPQAAPVPALKYRLFPSSFERKEGNAVPIYLRLMCERNDAARKMLVEMPEKWNALPFDKLPLSEVEPFIKRWQYSLKQLDLGARRKTAEWNYTLDDGPVGLLLPDLQEIRRQGALLLLKARMEIAQSRYPDAVHTMGTGFSLADQVGHAPFLISALVEAAISDRFLNTVLDMAERPDSPNLYWALTALPRPLCDIRQGMETELRFPELRFPEMQIPDLADLDRPRRPAEWDATLVRARRGIERLTSLMDGQAGKPKPQTGTSSTDPAAASPDLGAAKKYLADVAGYAPTAIAQMPASQVLLLYLAGYSRQISDDYYKASYLPYFEAKPVLDKLCLSGKDRAQTEPVRLAQLMVPAINKVMLTQVRLERKVAALRVIEAIRIYAADHGDQLPERLDQIKEVPVPLDPGTNQAFQYRIEDGKADLESRIPAEPLASTGLRYTISLRK